MITVQGRVRNAMLRLVNVVLSSVLPQAAAPTRPDGPRVLVIRCDHLGDATLSTAPLQAIRDALQPSRLDVVCGPWAASIFQGHPAVDEILCIATPWWLLKKRIGYADRLRAWLALSAFIKLLRRRRYDVGIDLRGDLRHFLAFFVLGRIPERVSSDRTGGARLLTSCVVHREGVHEVERMFSIVAPIGVPHRGEPTVTRRSLDQGRRTELNLPARFVAVAPRGASPNRQWPALHVAELSRRITSAFGIPLVYLGSDADHAHAAEVESNNPGIFLNLAGKTTIPDLVAVLDAAELVVAIDSGPMHVAAALGRPVVALWGPGSPDMLPRSTDSVVVESPDGCSCSGPTCQFAEGAGRCYRTMMGAQVFAAAYDHLVRLEGAAQETSPPVTSSLP